MPNLKCKICGTEFPPIRERHYISRDLTKTGLAAAFESSDEPMLFDAFDCPNCGCQIITQQRKRQFDPKSEEATDEDLLMDMSNEVIAQHLNLNPVIIGHLRAAKISGNRKDIPDFMQKNLNVPIENMDQVIADTIFAKPATKPSSLYFSDASSALDAIGIIRRIVEEKGFISILEVDDILCHAKGGDVIGSRYHTASKWGWTDLSKARIVQPDSRPGFYISFPAICNRPEPKGECKNET